MISPPVPAEPDPPLRIVTPPYASVDLVRGTPALGSIFILDVDRGGAAVGGVASIVRSAPWTPVLVVTRTPASDPELFRELENIQGAPAFLVRRPEDGPALGALAQHAICSRRPVDPDQVAGYIAMRLRRTPIAMPLAIAMSAPARGLKRVAFGVRWLAGRLNALGSLDASDWREVFHLATGAGNPRLTSAQAAERMGLDLWTLRRRLKELADVGLEQYREYAGWEWFVEGVLRRHCGLAVPGLDSQAPLPGRQGHLRRGD